VIFSGDVVITSHREFCGSPDSVVPGVAAAATTLHEVVHHEGPAEGGKELIVVGTEHVVCEHVILL
jgi:hypothetical protein